MDICKIYRDFFYYSSIKMIGVYCLYCKNPEVKDMYVGYSQNYRKRILEHRWNTYNKNNTKKYNMKVYRMIRENGGWDNWTYAILEENCGKERERYYYELLEPTMNTQHSGLTLPEYRKKYYATEKGRKVVLENFRRKVVCDLCGKTMSKSSLCRHKKNNCPNRPLQHNKIYSPIIINF
jgi:predicted GIY-YIG superfamily endonuclease